MPVLAPGTWIGVVGGGQLGRMLATEAKRMGYPVCVLDPDPHCPASQLAERVIACPYNDPDGAKEFADQVATFTYEFENVDVDTIEAMGKQRPVYPSPDVLHMKQSRVREKQTLTAQGFPVAEWAAVSGHQQLEAASQLGFPLVLKTATEGYDGKGQWLLSSSDDIQAVSTELGATAETFAREFVAEQHVPFVKELSVICARSSDGTTVNFPVVENIHSKGILDITIAPAPVSAETGDRAQGLVADIAAALDVKGLLAVELFLLEDGRLLVNELAPRPHNSGHYTLDACVTSQFEQLVRVLCGLPLGETTLLTPAVMVNLLGDIWATASGQPDLSAPFWFPGVKLHLYGKSEARRGRKMGHLTALASTTELALERALAAREAITKSRVGAGGR